MGVEPSATPWTDSCLPSAQGRELRSDGDSRAEVALAFGTRRDCAFPRPRGAKWVEVV